MLIFIIFLIIILNYESFICYNMRVMNIKSLQWQLMDYIDCDYDDDNHDNYYNNKYKKRRNTVRQYIILQ